LAKIVQLLNILGHTKKIVQLINILGYNCDMKMYFLLHKIVFFCVYVPIHLTIVKYLYLVKKWYETQSFFWLGFDEASCLFFYITQNVLISGQIFHIIWHILAVYSHDKK